MPKNQDDEFWELLNRMEQAMPEEPPLPEEGAGAAGAFAAGAATVWRLEV